MMVDSRFATVRLPNGTYLEHRSFFSFTPYDISLRREDGKLLVNDSIEFVCFNEQFVEGTTFPTGPRWDRDRSTGFIYERGQDEAIFSHTKLYYEVARRSNLSHETGCGVEGALKGFYILLRDPKYRD